MRDIETTKDKLLLVLTAHEIVHLYVVGGYEEAVQIAEACLENNHKISSEDFELYTLPALRTWHPDEDDRHSIHSYLP